MPTIAVRDAEGQIRQYNVLQNGTTPGGDPIYEPVAATHQIAGSHEVVTLTSANVQYAIDLTGLRLVQVSALDPDSTAEWRASLTAGQVATVNANSAIESKFYGKTKAFIKEAPSNEVMSGSLYVGTGTAGLKLLVEKWVRV